MPNKINPLTGKFDYFQDADLALQQAKDYADSIVLGLLDDRGSFTPVDAFPSTGGSGADGVIMKGDLWFITGLNGLSVMIGDHSVKDGDTLRALSNTPGQTSSNWGVMAAPSDVRVSVPTDSTVGTASITAEDMWNRLTSDITASGSIGKLIKDNLDAQLSTRATNAGVITELNTSSEDVATRLRNVATVDIVGEQISSI